MATITEDFVSFETAKLLKEKGFDEATIMFYRHNISHDKYDMVYCNEADEDMGSCMAIFKCNTDLEETYRWDASTEGYSAPTLQMAMKWLREEFDLIIYIKLVNDGDLCHDAWGFVIYNKFTNEHVKSDKLGFKYEYACEAAIKYCLKNLI